MKKQIIYLFIPVFFSCSEAYKVYEVTGVVLDIDENGYDFSDGNDEEDDEDWGDDDW
ncbi:hypothetical protein OAC64_00320 [bacterium]|nr:hypothetical protein [bacterium]